MTTFIYPPQELSAEKARQIVRDVGYDLTEEDSQESRLWRSNAYRIVNASWHRGFADHARAHRACEEAMRKLFGDDETLCDATMTQEDHND